VPKLILKGKRRKAKVQKGGILAKDGRQNGTPLLNTEPLVLKSRDRTYKDW